MSDTKVLQAILDGQNQILKDIKETRENLSSKIDVNNERINKLGLQIANLEDDVTTIAEFDTLEKRVSNLEDQVKN